MKIVAALTDPADAALAEKEGADMIELRLDLMEIDPVAAVQQCRKLSQLPIIATFRSAQEGGRYFGDGDEWEKKILPVLPLVDYVDVEQRFARNAACVKLAGKKIIASHHAPIMMPLPVLFVLERELRAFGDIVKIIMTPQNENDIIELLAFTHEIKLPICTGVMGSRFRFARAVLPLFGSELVYCHVGKTTAEGQYSVGEFVQLKKMLLG
ncbi:type I 3-dehydroquinate dehydratase [uncultured Methanoregula sp.]|uniref:type I 3-dehydroquinate dehydratase n=1 Tax=uncultured Methanoregula sp. TaxID=1005933 RepID=UPI002AAACD2C|nr:type I 3-dehydroquinate dehydratase [uncultured Methanoregula sp.]